MLSLSLSAPLPPRSVAGRCLVFDMLRVLAVCYLRNNFLCAKHIFLFEKVFRTEYERVCPGPVCSECECVCVPFVESVGWHFWHFSKVDHLVHTCMCVFVLHEPSGTAHTHTAWTPISGPSPTPKTKPCCMRLVPIFPFLDYGVVAVFGCLFSVRTVQICLCWRCV